MQREWVGFLECDAMREAGEKLDNLKGDPDAEPIEAKY